MVWLSLLQNLMGSGSAQVQILGTVCRKSVMVKTSEDNYRIVELREGEI